jgi:hypothetical protein
MSSVNANPLESGTQQSGSGRTKRRANTRKRAKARASGGGSGGPSMAQIVRMAHEVKNADLQASSTFSSTAYTPFLLNNINQGTGGTNRTGREIQLESIRLSFFFTLPSTSSGDIIRVIVAQDRETRGVAFGTADVLQNNTYGYQQILSSHNFDNVPSRFKILLDEVVPLNPLTVTNAGVYQPVFTRKLYHIDLKGRAHYFNTTGNGVVDIDSGSIYMLLMNFNSTAGQQPNYNFDSRLVFRDV